MLHHRLRALACALIFFSMHSPAHAQDTLGLVTGPKTGTYYAFGKDIAKAVRKSGITVNVKSSEGSIDNIKRINSGENAGVGIVQSDVLGFLSRSKNPDSIRMAAGLRMIFPFYNEEVHILARHNVKSLTDLQGRNVAVGEEGSGSMLTAINLFSMMNISPSQILKIPPAQGVVGVLKGDIDAVVVVAGKPVRLFKNLDDLALPENQKYAHLLQQVHFLPLDDARMLEEYKPAEIRNADYRFISETIRTISVQAVLVAYDFSHAKSKKRCGRLAKLAQALRKALPALKEKGHPKWKEVNLEANLGIWKKDSCSWPQTAVKNEADKKARKELLTIIDKKPPPPPPGYRRPETHH